MIFEGAIVNPVLLCSKSAWPGSDFSCVNEGQISFSNCKGKEVTSVCYGTILEGFLCVFYLIHVAYRCFIPPIKSVSS